MARALGTLIVRGMVGLISIVITAVITVLVQRYLYETSSTPALMFAPPRPNPSQPNQSEADNPFPVAPPQGQLTDSTEADGDPVTDLDSKKQDDRPNQIMEQFWDKLNH